MTKKQDQEAKILDVSLDFSVSKNENLFSDDYILKYGY